MDAYTPFPVEGLSEAIGFHRTRLPLIILHWRVTRLHRRIRVAVLVRKINYPINVGGGR